MENKNLVRIGYNKNNDEYQLLISNDGGDTWDFSYGCTCKNCKDDESDEEPMFVYIGLIEELKKRIAYGYTVVY